MKRIMFLPMIALLLAACGAEASAPLAATSAPAAATSVAAAPIATLRVMTHDSFNVSAEVIKGFEQSHNAKIEFRKSGDAGSALNQAILSKGSPLADLLFGVDNTFLTRALDADIFEPYASPALEMVPADLRLDPSNRLLPVDYGYVVINYDQAALKAAGLTPPASLADLTQPAWKGKLAVQNPATSSPGLAFLAATVAEFGESGSYTWKEFWRDLRANDVLVSEGWEEAYYTHFSGSSGKGPRPLVVSYATSPAAEVFFSEGKLQEPPTANLSVGSFRQIEFVGILKGTPQRALAEQFIDFLLQQPFQNDIPLQMFVYPANKQAQIPELFTSFAQAPPEQKSLSPEAIGQGRERWIDEWTQVVLR